MAQLVYFRTVLNRFFKRKSSLLMVSISLILFLYLFSSNFSGLESKKPKSRQNLLPDFSHPNSGSNTNTLVGSNSKAHSSEANIHNSKIIKDYIQQLFSLAPDSKILNAEENQLEFTAPAMEHNLLSLSYLETLATIPPKWIAEVKDKHSKVTAFLQDKVMNQKRELKSGTDTEGEDGSLVTQGLISSGDGAVIIGGHKNDETWLALVSTRLFRKAGGVLPIEVLLPTREDYLKDREICDKYLPQSGAKCVIIEEILNLQQIEGIDLYIWNNFDLIKRELSILLSSFENVLFLTPQNVMLKPMEHNVFEKQLYKDNGLFVWSDYDLRTTLVEYYEIANIKVGNKKAKEFGLPLTEDVIKQSSELSKDDIQRKVNYHDLQNTLSFKQNDASELIINKKQHISTLLLSLYYNLNGHNVYYLLLTGKPNAMHGSKETISAAAHALNNKYYSINTNVDSNGYWYDGEFHGVSMLQYDPIIDHYSYEAYLEKYGKKGQDRLTWKNYQKWLKKSSERRSPLFLNINNPSLKPIELLRNGIVLKENGDRIRLISETAYFGNEYETQIWRVMNDYICYLSLDCEYINKHFGKGETEERKAFCNNDMKEHLLWVAN